MLNDIVKLRELIENGYSVRNVNIDSSGKAIITCHFSGMGNPIEGQVYYLITEDELVIEKERERLGK